MMNKMVFRFGVCSLLGGIFVLLLANTLYVPHAPHTNVTVTCPAGTARALPPPAQRTKQRQPTVQSSAGAGHTMIVDIRRSELDRGASTLASQARFVPSLTNGKRTGFKVYAIRPGSLPATLGLKNGDTLVAINDSKVADLITWKNSSFRRLTKPDLLDMELRRRGQPMRIVVVIHEDTAS